MGGRGAIDTLRFYAVCSVMAIVHKGERAEMVVIQLTYCYKEQHIQACGKMSKVRCLYESPLLPRVQCEILGLDFRTLCTFPITVKRAPVVDMLIFEFFKIWAGTQGFSTVEGQLLQRPKDQSTEVQKQEFSQIMHPNLEHLAGYHCHHKMQTLEC